MLKKQVDKKYIIWTMLLFSFLLSQGFIWKQIESFFGNKMFSEKTYICFQIEGVFVYTFFAIYYTNDKKHIVDWLDRYPFWRRVCDMFVSAADYIFVWTPKCLLLTGEILASQNITSEIESAKREANLELEDYKKSGPGIRILAGIGGVGVVIFIVCYYLSIDKVQQIADIMNLIPNIVLFFIVCLNAAERDTNKSDVE